MGTTSSRGAVSGASCQRRSGRSGKARCVAEKTYDNGFAQLWHADARDLSFLSDESVDLCVTSPPYWGLRKYSGVQELEWGGRPECEHRWQVEGHFDTRGLEGSTLVGTPPGPERRLNYQTGLCSLCGCWSGSLGLEPTPEMYVQHIVEVFREVRRVLKPWGTLWLNLGDSYAGSWGDSGHRPERTGIAGHQREKTTDFFKREGHPRDNKPVTVSPPGLKPKDLVGIPWRVAFALQADGWWLRSDIIWHKPNPMPESVRGSYWERHKVKVKPRGKGKSAREMALGVQDRNGGKSVDPAEYTPCPGCPTCAPNDGLVLKKGSWRPTKSHEYLFLLAKSGDYYGDGEAVREPQAEGTFERYGKNPKIPPKVKWAEDSAKGGTSKTHMQEHIESTQGAMLAILPNGRNKRSVWEITTQGFGLEMCETCGRIYNSRQYKRLPKAKYTTVNEEADEEEQHEAKRCACGACDAWLSHFATFPEALVEPCILAGSSEHGVCPRCGKSWVRVIEKRGGNYKTRKEQGLGGPYNLKPEILREAVKLGTLGSESQTIGWRATCSCGLPPEPAVVLDPFAGSGTVCLVAQKLGRRSVGVDLSLAYLELAQRRLAGVPLPLGREEGE